MGAETWGLAPGHHRGGNPGQGQRIDIVSVEFSSQCIELILGGAVYSTIRRCAVIIGTGGDTTGQGNHQQGTQQCSHGPPQ